MCDPIVALQKDYAIIDLNECGGVEIQEYVFSDDGLTRTDNLN